MEYPGAVCFECAILCARRTSPHDVEVTRESMGLVVPLQNIAGDVCICLRIAVEGGAFPSKSTTYFTDGPAAREEFQNSHLVISEVLDCD